MNAAAISILRSSFGEFVYLIGNYKIYPTLALVFVYLLVLLSWKPASARMGWVIVFIIVFWVASIGNSWGDVQERKQMLKRDYASIRAGGGGLGFTAEQQAKFGVDKVLTFFEANGNYHAD
jgi:hypothetical protein